MITDLLEDVVRPSNDCPLRVLLGTMAGRLCLMMALWTSLACGGEKASRRALDLAVADAPDAGLEETESTATGETSDADLEPTFDTAAEVGGPDSIDEGEVHTSELSEVDSPEVTDSSDLTPSDLTQVDLADLTDIEGTDPDAAAPDTLDGDNQEVDPGPTELDTPAEQITQDVPAQDVPVACSACAKYGKPVTAGFVSVPGLNELSGLAASRLHEGIMYAHNDSGDSPRFFAMDLTGANHGEFRLGAGASAVDWEDMAIGPCDTSWCIFIGDIGDNNHVRQPPQGKGYAVYVVQEPKELDQGSTVTVPFVVLPYRYPDVAKNSETLLVHPITGDIYIVIKDPSPFQVFRFPRPHMPGVQVELELVGTISMGYTTGGSIHPCGHRLLLRSYGPIYERILEPGQPFEAIFSAPAVQVPFLAESALTEAVEYLPDGLGYVHVAEGAGRPVVVVGCE